ncbi:hypothetical protein J7M28_09470 [bacterium]|nr:hypothetical protein [bacterium]
MKNGWNKGTYSLAILSLVLVGLLFSGCATVRAPVPEPAAPEPEFEAEPGLLQDEMAFAGLDDVTVPDDLADIDIAESLALSGMPESPVPSILQQRFDIKVRDAQLHDVIQTLVKGKGLNVIIPKRLEGEITLDVSNVTLEEIFDVVLRSFGYSWRIDNKFLIIIRGEPIKVLRVKQAPLVDIRVQIEKILAGRGEVISDTASRTLTLLNCDPTVARYIEEYVRAVDIRRPQVLIEVELCEVKLDSDHQLGVDWSFKDIDLGGWSGLGGAAMTFLSGTMEGQVLYAGLGNDHVDMILRALEQQGDLYMVSAPKIVALDRTTARMEFNNNIPYTEYVKTTDVNPLGVAYTEYRPTVAWREVGTRLEIRPEISSDGYVTMAIKPDIETLIGTVGGQPQTNRREGDLYARARDGRTVVIGGFMFDDVEETVFKVPLLGDIPYLGELFRMTRRSKSKRELVMFVTPHILTDENMTDFAEAERLNSRYMMSKPVGLPDFAK